MLKVLMYNNVILFLNGIQQGPGESVTCEKIAIANNLAISPL